jgi:hypothetical protein
LTSWPQNVRRYPSQDEGVAAGSAESRHLHLRPRLAAHQSDQRHLREDDYRHPYTLDAEDNRTALTEFVWGITIGASDQARTAETETAPRGALAAA